MAKLDLQNIYNINYTQEESSNYCFKNKQNSRKLDYVI